MRIVGEWLAFDDGIRRPCVHGRVAGADGAYRDEDFLIATGADRTVLGPGLLPKLGLPIAGPSAEVALQGIGGVSPYVLIQTSLELMRDDGVPIHLRGECAAFTDPAATELSILGRDVLNLFDVIVSRRRDEILLLGLNYRYRIEQA